MKYSKEEVLQYVAEEDVKFIRLAFCDVYGVQKNISVMPHELKRAFEYGIAIDASAIEGFEDEVHSDLFLHPDPSTLTVLPWRPEHGRVVRMFCNISYPDGTPYTNDTRSLLVKAVEEAKSLGYTFYFGAEMEFYLFRLNEYGKPTKEPYDNAKYMDIAPDDKGENVRRDICLTLEKLGIKPISSHHERGPGQNEICFKNNDALKACDDLLTFKTVVRTVAAMNGLHASFMPKPLKDEIGSGLHINLSLLKDGENLFAPAMLSKKREAESFIAGILARAKEMAVFLNPTINSYERLEDNEAIEAYNKIAWSYSNGPQLVRIEQDGFAKMQLRSADPSCNPYIAYALLLFAGAEGIENKMKLGKEADIENLEDTDTLPEDLKKAIDIARTSDFIARYVPKGTLDKFIEYKENEYKNYSLSKDKNEFVTKLYFNKI